jgi:hypothetical protein
MVRVPPLCRNAAAIAWDTLYPEEEFEGKIPYYPYMRVRG